MRNSLAKQYTFFSLVRFALPNMVMMVFLSLYTIIDGVFVSRFVGTTALSAVNIMYPAVCIQMAVGIMLATGGSAVIAKKLGEKQEKAAKSDFSLIILVSVLVGVCIAVLGNVFLDQIVRLLGASVQQADYCRSYGSILFAFAPFFFLQTAFQTLFVTAGKPGLGLAVTVAAGVANMVLDYVFVAVLHRGIAGAAVATGIGYCVPAIAGLLYFACNRRGILRFVKPVFNGRMLCKACANGSSEMVSNLANAVTTFLFNYQFMRFYQEDGVASITIVLYFQFVFTAVYFGYAMGVSPVISYKYGSGERAQLQKIVRYSLLFILLSSAVSFFLSWLLLEPALHIFTHSGSNVFQITHAGFPLFALSFLAAGISIFASAMFTAFSDGKTSAVISFARTFFFLAGAILLLPLVAGARGVWLAAPVAEGIGCLVAIGYLLRKKAVFHY